MRMWMIQFLLVSLVLCLGLGQPCFGQGQKFKIAYDQGVDLEVFVKFVAKATAKSILYDSSIKGKKIFIITPDEVTEEELYRLFLSVIEYNGFIIEETGKPGEGLLKIKRNIQGPWIPTRTIYTAEELNKVQGEDEFISMVIALKYISAREVQTTLRALRIVNPQGGNLAGIEGSNTILISDFAPNVKRIYNVIQYMDQKGPERAFRVFKLLNASADDVVEKLKEFVSKEPKQPGFGSSPNLDEIKITADRRLNAVIVEAYADKMVEIEALIHELDQSLAEETPGIHVVNLKHADATKLQETLAKLLEDGKLVEQKNPAQGTAAAGATGGGQSTPASRVEVEPQTNSLIVKADRDDWREIDKIIQQVDVRRAQVLLEGAVLEVSPNDVFGLGVEIFWADAPDKDGDRLTLGGLSDFGFSNLVAVDKDGKTSPIDKPTGTDLKFGKSPTLTRRTDFPNATGGFATYKDIFTIPILVRAMERQGDFKVLSMPRLLTNDNEGASIKVSDAAPSQVTTQGTSGNPSVTSFGGFQEAGTTLNITPHISGEKNYLRLEIEQIIEEFDRTSAAVAGVPPKVTRRLVTSVTVPDNQTIAIGGLISEKVDESLEKVPFLGDLPLLGFLFQTRVITHKKKNIYLFVTPHILREEHFRDLLKYSHEHKLEAQKLGANIGAFDPQFAEYQKKYSLQEGELEPIYLLDYTSPTGK